MGKKTKKPRLRLGEVLKEKGISKYKLAQLLGKHTSAVAVYFKEGYNPTFSTLTSWAEVLECKVSDLIDE
jgi:DNA-binding Xre family transcriptional regulator